MIRRGVHPPHDPVHPAHAVPDEHKVVAAAREYFKGKMKARAVWQEG